VAANSRRRSVATKDRAEADTGRRLVRESRKASEKTSRVHGQDVLDPAELENVTRNANVNGLNVHNEVALARSRKILRKQNEIELHTARLRSLDARDPDMVEYVRPAWVDMEVLSESVGNRFGIIEPFQTCLDNAARELHVWRHKVGRLDDPINRVPELEEHVRPVLVPSSDVEWTLEFARSRLMATVVEASNAVRRAVSCAEIEGCIEPSCVDSWYRLASPVVLQRCADLLDLLRAIVPSDAYPILEVPSSPRVVDVYGDALVALVHEQHRNDVIIGELGRIFYCPLPCALYGCGLCPVGGSVECVLALGVGPLEIPGVYKALWDSGLCEDPGHLEKFLETKIESRRLSDVWNVDQGQKEVQRDLDLPKAYRCLDGAIAGPPSRVKIEAMVEEAREELYKLHVCCVDDMYVTDLNPYDEADVEVFSVQQLHEQLPSFFERLEMKDDEYPSALMRQYRLQTYFPACDFSLHGLVLSHRGVHEAGDGSGLQLTVCFECLRSLRSSEPVPRFASANHFLIGCLKEHFRLEGKVFEPTVGDITVTTPVYNHAYMGRVFNDPKGHLMMQGHSFLTHVSMVSNLKNFPRRTDEALYKCVIAGALVTDEGWRRRLVDPLMVSPCAWTIAEFFQEHNPRYSSWEGVENRGSFESYHDAGGLVGFDNDKGQYSADGTGGPALDVAHCMRGSCPQTTCIKIAEPTEPEVIPALRATVGRVKAPVVEEAKPDSDSDGTYS
jgi:hypothetical protein